MEYMQDWVFVKILLSIYLPEKNENCIWLKYVQIGQLINLQQDLKQNDFVFYVHSYGIKLCQLAEKLQINNGIIPTGKAKGMIPVYNFILIYKSNHFDIRIKCHFFATHRQYACILISRSNSSGLHSGCPVLVIDIPLLCRNTNLFGDNLTSKFYYRNICVRTDWNYSPIDSLRVMAGCTQFAVSLIQAAIYLFVSTR